MWLENSHMRESLATSKENFNVANRIDIEIVHNL